MAGFWTTEQLIGNVSGQIDALIQRIKPENSHVQVSKFMIIMF